MDLTPQGSYSLKEVFGFTCKVWLKGVALMVGLIILWAGFFGGGGGEAIPFFFMGAIVGLAITAPAAVAFLVVAYFLLNKINLQNPRAVLSIILSLILIAEYSVAFIAEVAFDDVMVLFIIGLITASSIAVGTTRLQKQFVAQE